MFRGGWGMLAVGALAGMVSCGDSDGSSGGGRSGGGGCGSACDNIQQQCSLSSDEARECETECANASPSLRSDFTQRAREATSCFGVAGAEDCLDLDALPVESCDFGCGRPPTAVQHLRFVDPERVRAAVSRDPSRFPRQASISARAGRRTAREPGSAVTLLGCEGSNSFCGRREPGPQRCLP